MFLKKSISLVQRIMKHPASFIQNLVSQFMLKLYEKRLMESTEQCYGIDVNDWILQEKMIQNIETKTVKSEKKKIENTKRNGFGIVQIKNTQRN